MVDHVDFDVQVQMSSGSPAHPIVDLPDRAVAGPGVRVSTSLDSIGRSDDGLVGEVFRADGDPGHQPLQHICCN